jgi:hypothetical protein
VHVPYLLQVPHGEESLASHGGGLATSRYWNDNGHKQRVAVALVGGKVGDGEGHDHYDLLAHLALPQ